MRRFKNKIKNSCLLFLALAMTGCNSWLDITPVGVQTSGTFWQTKEEAEQVLMSSYIQLRACMPYFFRWSEVRADELDFGILQSMESDQLSQDERSIRRLDIRPSNKLSEWGKVYTAIGRANSVIKFSETALKTDITFSQELCNSYVAEAVFVRSLCYFYLVRTFKDVPFITEPYSEDNIAFAVPKTSGDLILQQVIKDLETYSKNCKPGYETEWQSKGRATRWACYALMADIYLWQENYGAALQMCNNLEKGGFQLVPKDKYYEIFYPGNSKKESIFELQFRTATSPDYQSSELFNWFVNGSVNDGRYIISEKSIKLFAKESADDVRGHGYMYDHRYIGEIYWKYAGTGNRKNMSYPKDRLRGQYQQDPNWIFYRYAEILLMKAEAMTMNGTPYSEVCTMLDTTIRKRAGYKATEVLPVPQSELEMLNIILDERQKELLAEGKRWFDVLRVARKQGYKYRSILIPVMLQYVPTKDRDMWKVKMEDEYCHYLPIPKKDIEASHKILEQNPFYKDVE